MAAKKSESKIILERTYNVPLRKAFSKAAKYRRAKKAVNGLKEFIAKHMKSEQIKIGPYLNKKMWEKGIRNPPHHVQVVASKNDQGVVKVELAGVPKEEAKGKKEEKKAKKEDKKEITEKVKQEKQPTMTDVESKKSQKLMKEAEKAEELESELKKEETEDQEFAETEESIKETIEEIKGEKPTKSKK